MTLRQSEIACPDQDTFQWLKEHQSFKNWQDASNNLLCIRGRPGSGKSTLMKHILDQPYPPKNNNFNIAFFFSCCGDELQRTRLGLLRSIVHQLSACFPQAFDELIQRFMRTRAALTTGQKVLWSAPELFDSLYKALPRVLKSHSLRILVDAIDECEDYTVQGLAEDLKKLSGMSRKDGFRCFVCFSSHSHTPIDPASPAIIQVDEQSSLDVERFVRRRLYAFDREYQDSVIHMAGPLFLSARILVESMQFSNDRDFSTSQQAVRNVQLHDSEGLLEDLFQSMIHHEGHQGLNLLKWVCLATRPLSLAELRVALALDTATSYASIQDCFQGPKTYSYLDDKSLESKIRVTSRGMLEVVTLQDRKMVRPIHEAVKIFFLSDRLRMLSSQSGAVPELSVPQCHLFLAGCCIRYLRLSMKEPKWDKSFNQRPELGLFSYASSAWAKHATLAGSKDGTASSLLRFLGWPSMAALEGFSRFAYHTQSLTNRTSRQVLYPIEEANTVPPLTLTWLHLWAVFGLRNLLIAALSTNQDTVKHLNQQDDQYRTPLHIAVANGHFSFVKVLLKKGANPNIQAAKGQSALHVASIQGNIGIQKALLDYQAHMAVNADLQTPLHCAVEREHASGVKLIIERGCNVNAPDIRGCSPLWHAARTGNTSIARLLLDHGADLEAKNQDGRTPLIIAACKSYTPLVRLLLDRGANVMATGVNERTALIEAVSVGNKPIVQLLLERKAEVNAIDNSGRSILMRAVEKRFYTIVQLLVDYRTAVNAIDKQGWTALMLAVYVGDGKITKLLLDRNADVTCRNIEGHSAIFYAVYRQNDQDFITSQQRAIVNLLFERHKRQGALWDQEWQACFEVFTTQARNQVTQPVGNDSREPKKSLPLSMTNGRHQEFEKTHAMGMGAGFINRHVSQSNGEIKKQSGRTSPVPLSLLPGGVAASRGQQSDIARGNEVRRKLSDLRFQRAGRGPEHQPQYPLQVSSSSNREGQPASSPDNFRVHTSSQPSTTTANYYGAGREVVERKGIPPKPSPSANWPPQNVTSTPGGGRSQRPSYGPRSLSSSGDVSLHVLSQQSTGAITNYMPNGAATERNALSKPSGSPGKRPTFDPRPQYAVPTYPYQPTPSKDRGIECPPAPLPLRTPKDSLATNQRQLPPRPAAQAPRWTDAAGHQLRKQPPTPQNPPEARPKVPRKALLPTSNTNTMEGRGKSILQTKRYDQGDSSSKISGFLSGLIPSSTAGANHQSGNRPGIPSGGGGNDDQQSSGLRGAAFIPRESSRELPTSLTPNSIDSSSVYTRAFVTNSGLGSSRQQSEVNIYQQNNVVNMSRGTSYEYADNATYNNDTNYLQAAEQVGQEIEELEFEKKEQYFKNEEFNYEQEETEFQREESDYEKDELDHEREERHEDEFEESINDHYEYDEQNKDNEEEEEEEEEEQEQYEAEEEAEMYQEDQYALDENQEEEDASLQEDPYNDEYEEEEYQDEEYPDEDEQQPEEEYSNEAYQDEGLDEDEQGDEVDYAENDDDGGYQEDGYEQEPEEDQQQYAEEYPSHLYGLQCLVEHSHEVQFALILRLKFSTICGEKTTSQQAIEIELQAS